MRALLLFLAVIVTLVLSVTTPARAGELETPPLLRSDSQGQRLACGLANLGDKAIPSVTIRILDGLGAVANEVTTPLQPGQTLFAVASDADLGASLSGRCRVEGKGVSKRKTPVTFCVIPAADFECVTAVH